VSREDPSIPRDTLRFGTECCLHNVLRYLHGARSLINDSTLLPQASILFSYAVEEFGKGILLRRAYEREEMVSKIVGFYDHKTKLAAAFAEIPPDLLMLHVGTFQADAFQADTFDVDRVAGFEARMQSMYIGWDERSRTWTGPTDVDRPTLSRSIDGVELFVKNKLQEWIWVGS